MVGDAHVPTVRSHPMSSFPCFPMGVQAAAATVSVVCFPAVPPSAAGGKPPVVGAPYRRLVDVAIPATSRHRPGTSLGCTPVSGYHTQPVHCATTRHAPQHLAGVPPAPLQAAGSGLLSTPCVWCPSSQTEHHSCSSRVASLRTSEQALTDRVTALQSELENTKEEVKRQREIRHSTLSSECMVSVFEQQTERKLLQRHHYQASVPDRCVGCTERACAHCP